MTLDSAEKGLIDLTGAWEPMSWGPRARFVVDQMIHFFFHLFFVIVDKHLDRTSSTTLSSIACHPPEANTPWRFRGLLDYGGTKKSWFTPDEILQGTARRAAAHGW
jgi:hypothetical protein